MKNKSKNSIAREDSSGYQKSIDQMTWEEIIAKGGKPLSREEVMKRISGLRKN